MKTILIIVWAATLVVIARQNSAMDNINQLRYPGGGMQDEDLQDYLPSSQRRTAAYLLVEKRLLNKVLVEAMDIIIEYRIYNVGSQTATDVRLRDSLLEDGSKFAVVAGLTNAFLGNVLGGTNVSHTVVVRPKQNGRIEVKAAEVTYRWGENVMFGSSSEPGKVVILSNSAFHRQFSPHFEEWTAFAILSLPSLLIPFMLWFTSKSKNENLIKESGGIRKRRLYCYRDRDR